MEKQDLYRLTNGLCRGCPVCDGLLCAGELPGWGGIDGGSRFAANVRSWNEIAVKPAAEFPAVAFAPVTGAVQNLGLSEEAPFYFAAAESAKEAGIGFCIGDGFPDIKLESGIAAAERFELKADVFIKPYPDRQWLERAERAASIAGFIGIDIDSWQIATMAGQTVMERKTAAQLKTLKKSIKSPFVIKGICDRETAALLEEVRPDAAVISNHGGRVASPPEGTAYLLQRFASAVRKQSGSVWVDGGLRTGVHLKKAAALGAERVLIGRPFIQAVIINGCDGVRTALQTDYGFSNF